MSNNNGLPPGYDHWKTTDIERERRAELEWQWEQNCVCGALEPDECDCWCQTCGGFACICDDDYDREES